MFAKHKFTVFILRNEEYGIIVLFKSLRNGKRRIKGNLTFKSNQKYTFYVKLIDDRRKT